MSREQEEQSVNDALDAVLKVRRQIRREIVEFWKNSHGKEGHAGYSQRDFDKALEWAHNLWNEGSRTPAAVRFRRYYRLDQAVAVLQARLGDIRFGGNGVDA